MADVMIDPTAPIVIITTVDTPLLVHLQYLYQKPGDSKWTMFFDTTVREDVPNQVVRTTLNKVPIGTNLHLMAVFSGATNSTCKVSTAFSQKGISLGPPMTESGKTGNTISGSIDMQVSL